MRAASLLHEMRGYLHTDLAAELCEEAAEFLAWHAHHQTESLARIGLHTALQSSMHCPRCDGLAVARIRRMLDGWRDRNDAYTPETRVLTLLFIAAMIRTGDA